MDDLEAFRLDEPTLAAIDNLIAAMPERDPAEIVAMLAKAHPGTTVGIAGGVILLALYRRCSAAEAQEELFAAFAANQLTVQWK